MWRALRRGDPRGLEELMSRYTPYVAAVAAGAKLFQLLGCPMTPWGPPWPPTADRMWGPGGWSAWDRESGPVLLGVIYSAAAFGAMLLFSEQCAMLFLEPTEPELALLTA